MSMEREIILDWWYEVDTTNGITFIPSDVESIDIETGETVDDDDERWTEISGRLAQYCEGTPQSVKLIHGYGARLSMPGYLDCTDWSVFETEAEAEEYLTEMYGDDDEPEDEDEDEDDEDD